MKYLKIIFLVLVLSFIFTTVDSFAQGRKLGHYKHRHKVVVVREYHPRTYYRTYYNPYVYYPYERVVLVKPYRRNYARLSIGFTF